MVRASTAADLVHRDEVAALVGQRRGRLQEVLGPRHKVRLDARLLRPLVPDIAAPRYVHLRARRVHAEIADAAQQLGARAEQIHTEAFGF